MRAFALAAALMLGLGGPAQADEPAVVQALAEDITHLIPEAGFDWTLDWSALGARARHIRWHLAGPDEPNADGVVRRTGWIAADGRQIGVVLCGDDEQARKLVARLDERASPGQTPPLVAALEAEGMTVRPAGPHAYHLSRLDRRRAWLSLTSECTPEDSAAARRCWTDVEVWLHPAYSPMSRGAPHPSEHCTMRR